MKNPFHKHHWDAVGMSLDIKSVIYECRTCGKVEKGGMGRGLFDVVTVDGDFKGIVFGVKHKLIKTIQQYEVTSKYGVNDEARCVEISPSDRRGSCFMGEIKEFEQVYLEKYGEEYASDDS